MIKSENIEIIHELCWKPLVADGYIVIGYIAILSIILVIGYIYICIYSQVYLAI